MKTKALFISTLLLFLLPPLLLASQKPTANQYNYPIEDIDLFLTESVYSAEKGEIQLTLRPFYVSSLTRSQTSFPVGVQFGITDRWLAEFQWEAYKVNNSDGLPSMSGSGESLAGLKYALVHIADSTFSVAFKLDVLFPTGDINKGLTDGLYIIQPSIAFANDFPNWHYINLFFQTGVRLMKTGKHPDNLDNAMSEADEFILNAGLFIPVGKLIPVLQFNWENDTWSPGGTSNQLFVTPGLVWQPAEIPIECGIAFSIGLTRSSDHLRLFSYFIFDIL